MAHITDTTIASGEYAVQEGSGCKECARSLTVGNTYDQSTVDNYSYPSLESVIDSDDQADAFITCHIVKLSNLLELELGNKNRNKKLLKKIYILSLIREYFYNNRVDRTNTLTGLDVYSNEIICSKTDEDEYNFVTNDDTAKHIIREYLKEITKDCNTYKI